MIHAMLSQIHETVMYTCIAMTIRIYFTCRHLSLASQPYFSSFPVGGARVFSLPLAPPTGNKEKYGWLVRLVDIYA